MFESDNSKPAPSSFDLLNDGNTKSYEFPPLADFPLQSQDEVMGCLKKRPHSPDLQVSHKKLTRDILSSANGKEVDAADRNTKAEELKLNSAAKGPNAAGNLKVEALEMDAPITEAKHRSLEDAPVNDSVMLAAGALTSFAARAVSASNTSASSASTTTESSEDGADAPMFGSRDPNTVIDLIPVNNDTSILSDYNNLLVRNIEFFYPIKSHLNYENLSGSKNASNMSATRLGLRCIHCKNSTTHVTAAAFFPSTIGSIASGLGTIGSRHFGLGKCPNNNLNSDLVGQMIETKKTSSIQTRTNGRIGLDAYCRNIAHQYGIFDDEVSGICWVDGKPHPSIEADRSSIASVLAGMKHDTNIEMRPFVPAEMACFWECNGCRSVDIPFRAKGSVVFSVEEPTPEMMEDHLKICNGRNPLMVPRNAAIEPFYGNFEGALPPIRVKWESSKNKAKEGRSRRNSIADTDVPDGVDDDPLCFDTDKPYTTDFAFFIVSQLARCHLTKTGGSRGACPIGYAGLACKHCAGDANERRFFYSTADQMRNSFSHIPTHLAACEKCPAEIKAKIEEYKATRNRQKSLLKPGYHKIFIDSVWDRMHNGKRKQSTSGVASQNNDMIRASQANGKNGVSQTHGQSNTAFSRDASPLINASSALVHEGDKYLTSDLTLFVLLQVEPYSMLGSSADDDSKEIGFPGLICSHCKTRKFFTTSGEHLSGLLITISNHMQSCQSCPKSVRSLLTQFRGTHEKQLKQISVKSHDQYMEKVWARLVKESRSTKKKSKVHHKDDKDNVCYLPVDQSKPLVTPEDENLVTAFTYLTMKQVRACNLDKSMNGSRSQFADGFPGIECLHCANTSNPRRFFYRTVEILSGNYAHIPNHLATCAHCPADVKAALAEKKEEHMRLKHKLDRGSQKRFFNNIWDRLHACSHK